MSHYSCRYCPYYLYIIFIMPKRRKKELTENIFHVISIKEWFDYVEQIQYCQSRTIAWMFTYMLVYYSQHGIKWTFKFSSFDFSQSVNWTTCRTQYFAFDINPINWCHVTFASLAHIKTHWKIIWEHVYQMKHAQQSELHTRLAK